MKVTLDIPDWVNYQLVYRLERTTPSNATLDPSLKFVFLKSAVSSLPFQKTLIRSFGIGEALKAIAKLMTGSRGLYAVLQNGDVKSYGWCTVGRCQYYAVEKDAVVIGPIWSDPQMRGKGIATTALQLAIDEYVSLGRTRYYIDTSKENTSAQRVFQKCGFGDPVALYFRPFS